MLTPSTRTLALAAALTLPTMLACAGRRVPDRFDESARADDVLSAAQAEAAATNRLVLLELGGDWCPYTRGLDRVLEEHPDVAPYIDEHWVVARAHMDPENPDIDFAMRFEGVDAFPFLVGMTPSGEVIGTQSTEVLEREGAWSHDAVGLMAVLDAWEFRAR